MSLNRDPLRDADQARRIAEAIKVLAETGRVIAVVIPRGVTNEQVLQLKREIDARLEALVATRGPLT